MAIVGTDEEDQNPTSSSSGNAVAAKAAAQGTPYGGASGGGFAGGSGTGSGQGATTGVAAGGGGSPAMPSGSTPTPGGGGYANLSQYLSANQSAGATTGQAAENVVQQAGNVATAAQNTYNADATNDISKATAGLGVDQGVLGKINAGAATVDQGTLSKIAAGGNQYAPDASTMKDMSGASISALNGLISGAKTATGQYSGPTNLNSDTVKYGGPDAGSVNVSYGGPANTSAFTGQTAADQATAVQQAGVAQGQVANANGGQAGVSALLSNAYSQPNYSQGENSLDAFLAGGTTGGQQALSQATGVGQNVSNAYGGIQSALAGKINAGMSLADKTNSAYQDAINAAQKTSANTLNTYMSAEQAAQAAATKNAAADQAASKQAQSILAQRASDAKAASLKAAQVKSTNDNGIMKGANDVSTTAKKGVSDTVNAVKTAGGQASNALKAIPNDVANAVKNPLSTVPNTIKTTTNAADNTAKALGTAGKDVSTGTKNVGNAIASAIQNPAVQIASPAAAAANAIRKSFHFSEGGEIPSYAKIHEYLKGCSK